MSTFSATGIMILLFLLAESCVVNPVTGKKQVVLVSEAQEMAMGQQYDPSIIAEFGMYEDETMQEFINSKGKEMGAISHRPNINYQFRILDSPVINAFAVPGGYVYFTRGIMAHFNNEAEFAGVLGHEIGHITARHSVVQMSKQQLYTIGFMAGMIASEDFRQFADIGQQALGALFLKFGRDDESQSDELGVNYSSQIGYDSHEMANFFGVLSRKNEQSGQRIPEFQSTHPDPANRFQRVHELSDAYQKSNGLSNLKVGRDSYLAMIDGIVFGEDPRQGYVNYNTFFHPVLKFHFPVPVGWRLVNSPQSVQMAPEDGKALMIMTLSPEKTLQAAVEATITGDNLAVVEQSNTTVNGMEAHAMISTIKTDPNAQQQTTEQPALRILTYHILYNGLIYKFHGMSTADDFNTYFRTFSNTMGNFNKLTDPQKINVTPDKIRIVTAQQATTLQTLFRGYSVPEDEMESTAILNNMQLTDQIPLGTKFKIIVKGQKG